MGIREASSILGFNKPSDYVRDYSASRQWLVLLTRQMDAVAPVRRLAATLSPGAEWLRTQVDSYCKAGSTR